MLKRLIMIAGTVAGAMYFLDPQNGAQRRKMVLDQLGSSARTGASGAGQAAARVGGQAYGIVQETVKRTPDNPNPDDNTLRDRVESEIFRDPETSRENINISVVDGTVEIRGELPNQGEIDDLIQRVQKIPNVRNVHSYMHLPGTPAPNKASAIEAS